MKHNHNKIFFKLHNNKEESDVQILSSRWQGLHPAIQIWAVHSLLIMHLSPCHIAHNSAPIKLVCVSLRNLIRGLHVCVLKNQKGEFIEGLLSLIHYVKKVILMHEDLSLDFFTSRSLFYFFNILFFLFFLNLCARTTFCSGVERRKFTYVALLRRAT